MKKTFPKLYTRNTNGSINEWWAEVDGASYRTMYGRLDGKLVTTLPIFTIAKNVGKTNATTPEEQAFLEVEQLYKKQRKLNYFDDIKDVDTGFLEPQLAKPGKDFLEKIDWSKKHIIDAAIPCAAD